MPNDLRSNLRADPSSSSIDDALASLQVEDFSELPPPSPFSTSGRLKDKRHARAFRPVLQRQKAVLCIEDLDNDDGVGATPVRMSARGYYRRAASADYPRTSSSSAFLSSPVLGPQRERNDTSTPEATVRLIRPRRGFQSPY